MKRIALTGGIGCGKSTVAQIFQTYGIPIIDADAVVHRLYQDKAVIQQLTDLFGQAINEAGMINRQKLAAIIFQDEEKRAILTKFFQPRVNTYVKEKMEAYEQAGAQSVIYDATLIYEWQIEKDFDLVIVVSAPLEARIKRICDRDQITAKQAMLRIQAQMPLAQKEAMADYIIENKGDFADLRQATERLILQLAD